MNAAGWFAPDNKSCICAKLHRMHEYWQKRYTVKLFTAAQVALAAKAIGLSDKTAAKLRTELEA